MPNENKTEKEKNRKRQKNTKEEKKASEVDEIDTTFTMNHSNHQSQYTSINYVKIEMKTETNQFEWSQCSDQSQNEEVTEHKV